MYTLFKVLWRQCIPVCCVFALRCVAAGSKSVPGAFSVDCVYHTAQQISCSADVIDTGMLDLW